MQTLSEFLKQQDVDADLKALVSEISLSCQHIADLVLRRDIDGMAGQAHSENIQGEEQKKLDIITNDVMVEQLQDKGLVSAMVSEEIDDVIQIPEQYEKGRYLLCFDPLDGSSNIDLNLSVGTIFSILESTESETFPTAASFMQTGSEQVCAGFCVYGPSTLLVLTLGKGVNGFTLDRVRGEFILTHPNMTIPEDTAEFAINMSNQRYWENPIQRYIDECIQGVDGSREKNFNMRWNASMVAEVLRILIRGGIFMYPIDSKIKQKGGKLRLLYEANPMSFIVEQAGGLSSTGYQHILDIGPTHIHQRVPVILGSKNEVERLNRYHN